MNVVFDLAREKVSEKVFHDGGSPKTGTMKYVSVLFFAPPPGF